jgi:hypothetical protein
MDAASESIEADPVRAASPIGQRRLRASLEPRGASVYGPGTAKEVAYPRFIPRCRCQVKALARSADADLLCVG